MKGCSHVVKEILEGDKLTGVRDRGAWTDGYRTTETGLTQLYGVIRLLYSRASWPQFKGLKQEGRSLVPPAGPAKIRQQLSSG